MKNAWIVVVLAFLSTFPALAQERSTPDADCQHVETVDEVTPTPSPHTAAEDVDEPVAQTSCSSLDGTACSAPGFLVRCEWAPGEPGVCVCGSDGFWNCG